MDFGTATGLSTQDIRLTVAKIIRAAFGLLGVVAIGIVLAGGVMWMTSGGDEEKLTKAKKVLTNGVIGLTIMLLSFAITQFVLSRLTQALYGAGTVTIATEGGGTLPPGALAGGCADPGGSEPYICSVQPASPAVGALVTIRGYRFGSYVVGTSKVQIGDEEAAIARCEGQPSWSDNTVVFTVPDVQAGQSHPFTLTAGSGWTATTRMLPIATGSPGPGIACMVPSSGPPGGPFAIWGTAFGDAQGSSTVTFGGNAAVSVVSAWSAPQIQGATPANALSGEVTVTVAGTTSNPFPFTVTCTAGSQCSVSNCCVQGQCVETSACAPGGPPSTVGASCDSDAATPACQPIACGGGLRCDLGSCTCQEGPTITAVSPQTLVATTNGTAYRRAEDVPTGTQTVTAPNGAAGNYLTIRGRGFGDALCSNDATKRCSRNADCSDGGTCTGLGRVIFMGADGAADDQAAALAGCATAWSDTEVIAVVPAGAAVGPIRIESQDPAFFDQTDDARGTAIEHFRLNTTTRPGLCAITPSSAAIGASVALAGTQFGDAKGAEDAALFGDQSATTTAWAAAAINATVPAIAEGPIEVRIRNDGELSNGVTFTRVPEPIEPRIQDITPSSGGGGQYVTIRGQNFGVAIGEVTFGRGLETYKVRPRFPDQCSANWWKGNEVTIRIPANTGEWGPPAPPTDFNALGAYEVRVHVRDGNAFRASNAVTFTVTTDQPTPGICAITPSSGPARISVSVIGERFGGAVGSLRFFDAVAAAIGDGGADRAGNFQWAEGLIRDVLVPATARTGPVRLWTRADVTAPGGAPTATGEARGSNPVTFEVKDCRAGGASACAAGQVCCGNGTCVANAAACVTGPNQGSFQWTFSTGVVPKMPRVVESCDAFSPSPWDSQGQGGQACVNANVRVQFSTSMAKADGGALDATAAGLGMQVFRCGAGTNVAAAAGGTFEATNALTGWRVKNAADTSQLETVWLEATLTNGAAAGEAHSGTGYLKIEKRGSSSDLSRAKAPTQPRPTDVPRDTPTDRHHFAIQAPASLIPDTAGTTYTARVFVRGANPNQNQNMRAGIVVGRDGGTVPTAPGYYQQVANEVTINGTWQELSLSVTFDSGKNSRASLDAQGNPTGDPIPGFVRLYVTGPPADQLANADDVYSVRFDDLEVVRSGDPCAVRNPAEGLNITVSSAPGRLLLSSNVITVSPPTENWASGTWYEVIAYGTDGDGKVALKGAGTPQLRLDGDKDGQEGGNYRFRFRTRESAEPCAVQSVLTTPREGLATQPGPPKPTDSTFTAINLPGLVHLRADGIGDPAACFLLNTAGMPWSWATTNETNPSASPYVGFGLNDASPPTEQVIDNGGRWCFVSENCAVITCSRSEDCTSWGGASLTCTSGRCTGTSFCTARRCNFPIPRPCTTDDQCASIDGTCNEGTGQCVGTRNYFANTATVRAVKETPVSAVGVPQPAVVQATVAPTGGQSRTGTSNVTVRFEKPRVVTVYPTAACQQACPNGTIAAIMNVDLLPSSVTATTVRLMRCTQENCRRSNPDTEAEELAPVVGATATACPRLPADSDPCVGKRVGSDPQIIITLPDNTNLLSNQSYRLILTGDADGVTGGVTGVRSAWDVPLDQLNYADNNTGAIDAYSWTFRTRTEPCGVSRVEISPNPLIFQAVGQREAVTAVPFSAPDQCSPAGQPLDAETLPWVWDVANANGDVADFTTVTAEGAFAVPGFAQLTQTSRVAGPSCTLSCLRPGSRRVPGICGNGVVEVVAEECERQTDGTFVSWCDAQTCLRRGASPAPNGTCGDGDVDAGEECDKVDATGASSATGTFPAWCDPGTCLRKGSGFGSVCGNGSPATQADSDAPIDAAGDGEDCDDGNTVNGDGCSSRCLMEGTPQRYHATNAPEGILARCGDGVVADGLRSGTSNAFDCDGTSEKPCATNHEPAGGEECDPGAVDRVAWATARCDYDRCVKLGALPISVTDGTCGNGTLQVGEQCDDGAVGSCSAASGANAGNACVTNDNCGTGGACEDPVPLDGDGCSSTCLLEGASITWRHAVTGAEQPSMCGDGTAFDGQGGRPFGGEACDAGSASGNYDPVQIIEALGAAPANAAGIQGTSVTANAGAPVPGQGTVQLVCGHQSDNECNFPPAITSGTYGIDRAGCCQQRPTITNRTPPHSSPSATNVCRNAQVTVRFDKLMDPGSVGVATDVATGAATRRGAVLERCKNATVGCRLGTDTDWEATAATPTLAAVLDGSATVSELRFGLTSALAATTTYRVRVFDESDDATAVQLSMRSLDGVRLKNEPGNTWTFTTGSQVCLMSRVEVQPSTYLLQRRESRAPLEVMTWALAPSGESPIVSIPGTYAWSFAWSSTATDVSIVDPNWTDSETSTSYPCAYNRRCAFKPAEPAKNGDTFGQATVTITQNIFAPTCTQNSDCGSGRQCTDHGATNGLHCTGETFTDAAQLRALICENPWPAVTNPATWAPHPIAGENISIAYCRDQGDGKVCRNDTNKPCSQNSDCPTGGDAVCVLDARDDLPAFEDPAAPAVPAATLGNGRDELRKEFFFLPRDAQDGQRAHYCSVSGERCDPALAGICPPGEFCRAGQDAIGIRIYENEQHVAAQRWFERQGFTEATTPIEVDQYRGVRAGRSLYLNIANLGSIFTNLLVLSVNDGAVEETKEILTQVLDGIRFSDNLTEENTRICADVGRCSQGDAPCRTAAECTGTGNTCDLARPVACVSDRDCRVGITAGTCAAPKDKLARDVRRLEDLNEIRLAIEAYGRGRARCSVSPQACDPSATAGPGVCPAGETCFTTGPDLSAGTFVPGFTTSRWPSWAAELGKALGAALPVDPLNMFGGACVADATENAKYDQGTCWNQEVGMYAPPAGSYLYEYKRTPTGTWEVRGGFEYIPDNALEPVISGNRLPANMSIVLDGVPSQAYSATGRCGDGAIALSQGEECDPPGTTGVRSGESTTCMPSGGAAYSGFQFRTCQQNCQWSDMSECGSKCGNFVWDSNTGEQCDVGPRGGRVPAGHPQSGVIPGISTVGYWNLAATPVMWDLTFSKYACSPTCTWTGGRCGDTVVQAGYGESCDNTANVATTPAQSSAAKHYSCTPPTDPNPCRGTGGFCGDGAWQFNEGEQCEGEEVRSCLTNATCGGDGPACTRDADCASQPEGKRRCVVNLTPTSGSLPWSTDHNASKSFAFTLQEQGSGTGSVRVTLETSNDGDDLSNLTRDQIEATGASINDYNPRGAEGGSGLYHRLEVEALVGGGVLLKPAVVWALASTTPQVNSVVIGGIPGGAHTLEIRWNNDWVVSGSRDSNLKLHRVTIEGTQTRSCGDPGQATACKVIGRCSNDSTMVCSLNSGCTGTGAVCRGGEGNGAIVNANATVSAIPDLGWSVCRAVGALCGNGTVDAGEECDDGGKGRCANELTKACASSDECTGGAACEADLDLCTSECKRNVCGDSHQLAATCTAGHASKIGQPCTSNAVCGANGLCATEQCDLGTSNWRQGSQCIGGSDPRCVDDAVCPYGRQCNYCVIGSCSIATKQGGFCGDRVKNGPEACDVVAGTNQCENLSGTAARTQCEQAVSAALMPGGTCTGLSGTQSTQCQTAWSRQICNAACDATCPPATTNANLRFANPVAPNTPTEAKYTAGQTKNVRVDACRLLDAFKYDVELGPGVDVWPAPISIVVVTDQSGSMREAHGGRDVECDDSHSGEEERIFCAKKAIAGNGGLLDRLAIARQPGDVRVALVSFGYSATLDSVPAGPADPDVDWATEYSQPLTQRAFTQFDYSANRLPSNEHLLSGLLPIDNVSTEGGQQSQGQQNLAGLKADVNAYTAYYGATYTFNGIRMARAILEADQSARTKVIILMSDGAVNTGCVKRDVEPDGTDDGCVVGVGSGSNGKPDATAAEATTFKTIGPNHYLFTIAFPNTVPGMTSWSSNTASDTSFDYSGGAIAAFYEQIVGAIAGVSVTILPASGSSPSAVTYVSRTQSGVRVAAGDELAEMCEANGQPTTYRVKVDFRARPGSSASSRYVWFRNPSALVCTGPPWRP